MIIVIVKISFKILSTEICLIIALFLESSTHINGLVGRKIHEKDHQQLSRPLGSLSCENVKNYSNENDIRLLQYFSRLPWKSSFAFEYVEGLRKIASKLFILINCDGLREKEK